MSLTTPNYSFRDSGVEWLGEVPMHWKVMAIKRLVSVPITDGPHETPVFQDSGVPFLSAEGVSSGAIDFNRVRGFISEELDAEYSKKYSPLRHDIFMVKSGATTGITAIVETDRHFNIWSPLAAIRCNAATDPHFTHYFLRSRNFQEAIELNWSFGTQQNIGMGVIENLYVARPPLDEAGQIAKFLDYETAKIDALIEKQQQLIALLKEKRQAVISHAVTKGLNPDAPMRDSGVEWLGEVPAHWEVARINKFSYKITNGYVGPTRGLFVDDGIKYLQSLHIKSNRVVFTPTYYVSPEWSASKQKSVLREGDVLIVQTGDIGQSACVPAEFAGANCHALIVVATNQAIVSGQYLSWCLNSDYGSQSLKSIQTGALHPHLNCGTVKFLPIPVPPMEEQLLIVERVDGERARYDKLQLAAEEQIDLLQERRTALISAAVTGKIDVRGWKPPKPEPATEAA